MPTTYVSGWISCQKKFQSMKMPTTYVSGWISTQKKFQVDENVNGLFFWVDINPEKISSRLECQWPNFLGGYPPRKNFKSIRMPMTILSGWISTQNNYQVDWYANELTFWVDIPPEKFSSRLNFQWLNFLGGYPPRKILKSIGMPMS